MKILTKQRIGEINHLLGEECGVELRKQFDALCRMALAYLEENKWEPIQSAPKDRPIWIIEDGQPLGMTIPNQCMVMWEKDIRYIEGGYWKAYQPLRVCHPTHWRHLPNKP